LRTLTIFTAGLLHREPRILWTIVVLTKYENICDEITASAGAFSHFHFIRNYDHRLRTPQNHSTMMQATHLQSRSPLWTSFCRSYAVPSAVHFTGEDKYLNNQFITLAFPHLR